MKASALIDYTELLKRTDIPWHNPQNLTPEDIDAKSGWRFCLRDEPSNITHQYLPWGRCWSPALKGGSTTFKHFSSTYRTQTPLPTIYRHLLPSPSSLHPNILTRIDALPHCCAESKSAIIELVKAVIAEVADPKLAETLKHHPSCIPGTVISYYPTACTGPVPCLITKKGSICLYDDRPRRGKQTHLELSKMRGFEVPHQAFDVYLKEHFRTADYLRQVFALEAEIDA